MILTQSIRFLLNTLSIFILVATGFSLKSQNVVPLVSTPAAPAPTVQTCMAIDLGTTLTFNTSQSCGPDIEMQRFDPGTQIDAFPDQFYNKSGTSFTHQFTELGSYIFICDVTSFPATSVNGIADICFTVTAEPIPALGEWALMILFLSIAIIGAVGVRTYAGKHNSTLAIE